MESATAFAHYLDSLLPPMFNPVTGAVYLDMVAYATIISALIFWAFLVLYRPIMSQFDIYKNLSKIDKLWWDTTVSSSVHGPISGILAVLCTLAGHPNLGDSGDVFYTNTNLRTVVLCWTCGYCLQDAIFLMYHRMSKEYLFHHGLIIISYMSGLLQTPAFGTYFMCMLQTMELTALNANIRIFLEKAAMKETLLYKINGLLWTFLFFLNRVVWGSIVLYRLTNQISLDHLMNPAQFFTWFTGVLFLSLQYFWFYKIAQGVLKVLTGKKGKKVAEKVE